MILELHIVTYIDTFFGHCHVTLPFREIVSIFGPCHVTFPYMERLSFYGRFVQKVIVFCFSDSFVHKTAQQSDGSCTITNDSQFLYKNFRRTASSFLQTQIKFIL